MLVRMCETDVQDSIHSLRPPGEHRLATLPKPSSRCIFNAFNAQSLVPQPIVATQSNATPVSRGRRAPRSECSASWTPSRTSTSTAACTSTITGSAARFPSRGSSSRTRCARTIRCGEANHKSTRGKLPRCTERFSAVRKAFPLCRTEPLPPVYASCRSLRRRRGSGMFQRRRRSLPRLVAARRRFPLDRSLSPIILCRPYVHLHPAAAAAAAVAAALLSRYSRASTCTSPRERRALWSGAPGAARRLSCTFSSGSTTHG